MIAGPVVAEFVEQLNSLALTGDHGCNTLNLKLGKCIDADDESSGSLESTTPDGSVAVVHENDWGIEEAGVTVLDIGRIL